LSFFAGDNTTYIKHLYSQLPQPSYPMQGPCAQLFK